MSVDERTLGDVLSDAAPRIVRYALERIAKDWNIPPQLVGVLAANLPAFLRLLVAAARDGKRPPGDADRYFVDGGGTRPRAELLAAEAALAHVEASIERVLEEDAVRVRFVDARRVLHAVRFMGDALVEAAATRA